MLASFFQYLNPIARLGKRHYSWIFPLLVTIVGYLLLELYVYFIVKAPSTVGTYAILLSVAFIIYFAFHDGIVGGMVATGITVLYYFYLIYSLHYRGGQYTAGVITTIVLALLYIFLALVIGWLRQTIDSLIGREANEKRRLQAIVQQLPVGVLVCDNKGKIELVNKQVDILVGRDRSQHIQVGTIMQKMRNDRDPDTNPKQWPILQALATGRAVGNKEFTVNREDGKQVFLQISASPIHNREGDIIAAASIMTDITEQKEMDLRKDDFVNMASHELKTPITSMKLYIDSLLLRIKQYQDPRALKTIQSIKYQTERLQALVSDLLDVSRLQTGKLNFTKEQFILNELVEETIEGLQSMTKQQTITLVKHAPIKVYADRFRIYQVLTNLITNANKYSPEDSEITVRLKRVDRKAIVSVQDRGIGIARDQQKKIFDRLYQVTDDKEKTFPGFGMGLYISKSIVRRHRGSIWVESEKGKGSTFFFSLPLRGKSR